MILMLCSTYILAASLNHECKKWKEIYDADYYFQTNKDLQKQFGMNRMALYNHYVTKGLLEGRSGSPIFNYKYYRDHNNDLKRLTPVDTVIHFVKNGMREGRASHPDFDVKFYKAKYEDLRKAFGNNNERYYKHFLNDGYKNKRQGKQPVIDPKEQLRRELAKREQERKEREKKELEKKEQERKEREKKELERIERERKEREQKEREKREFERREHVRKELERRELERKEQEKKELERKHGDRRWWHRREETPKEEEKKQDNFGTIKKSEVIVSVTHLLPAENTIPSDIKKVAIFPYRYSESLAKDYSYLKTNISDKIADFITNYGTFSIVDRNYLETLINENMINASDNMSEEEMTNVAKLAGAQAIIVGEITAVLLDEQHIIRPNDFSRQITVGFTSEIIKVDNKQKILVNSFKQSYDSKINEKDSQSVRSIHEILMNFAEQAATEFTAKISNHNQNYEVNLYENDQPDIIKGLLWTNTNLYEQAIESFEKAIPALSDASIAYYNIGVCYEALNKEQEALKAYNTVINLNTNLDIVKDAMAGISRMHKKVK
jgi:hypothetical protein